MVEKVYELVKNIFVDVKKVGVFVNFIEEELMVVIKGVLLDIV